MTPIFIPTYGRAEVKTLDCLPPSLLSRVVLVVDNKRSGELLLSRQRPRLSTVLPCPVQGTGISYVRQWLVEHCKTQGIDCCIMLDDDIRLSVGYFRSIPGDTVEERKLFRRPRGDELVPHFEAVERLCLRRGVGFCSFFHAVFNTQKPTWAANKDNASTYFVNVPAILKTKASFLIPSTEDRKFILETIEAGYAVWSDTYVAVAKIGRPGRGGEAKVTNRGERVAAAIRLLAATYPRFVKLKESKNTAYIANYGTRVAATFYLQRMWDAVQRGENVRSAEWKIS